MQLIDFRGMVRGRGFVVGVVGFACALLAPICMAQSVLTWTDPVHIKADPNDPNTDNYFPAIATDGEGVWLAVWSSEDNIPDGLGDDFDILVARSIDNGVTWTDQVAVNSFATLDNTAGGGSGTAHDDKYPALAYDGAGNWLCVWDSQVTTSGEVNADRVVMSSVSSDGGLSWSDAVVVSHEVGASGFASVVAGGEGSWIVGWEFATDAHAANSLDNGQTWANTANLTNTSCCNDQGPALASDGAGNVMAVLLQWTTSAISTAYAYSSDSGTTWSPTTTIQSSTTSFTSQPSIGTDGKGTWVTVWISGTTSVGGAEVGNDNDIISMTTHDDGETWSEFTLVNSNATTDGNTGDLNPQLSTDGRGNWIAVWETIDGTDYGVLSAFSGNDGLSWEEVVPLNAVDVAAVYDAGPNVATDGRGAWIGLWASEEIFGASDSSDSDIVHAQAEFTGSLGGTFVSADDESVVVDCATVILTSLDGAIERLAVTDKNGIWQINELPEGTYNYSIFPVGFRKTSGEVEITVGEMADLSLALTPRNLNNGVRGTVRGFLFNEGEDKIPLVGVFCEARINDVVVGSTYTCGDGRYELHDLLPAGTKQTTDAIVEFFADGYIDDTRDVTLEEDTNDESNPTLEKALAGLGSLAGIVTDGATEDLIFGARLTVQGKISVEAETLEDGTYVFPALPTGRYDVRASAFGFDGDTQAVAVTDLGLEIVDFELGGGVPPELSVTPSSLNAMSEGGGDTITVTNVGGSTLEWTTSVTEGDAWLSAAASKVSGDGSIAVTISANTGGARQGTIEVASTNASNGPVSVTVTQEAAPVPPAIAVSPGSLSVGSSAGSDTIDVSNTGGGTLDWTATVTEGDAWLSVVASKVTGDGSITVTFDANMGESRHGTIEATSTNASNSPVSITVTQANGVVPLDPADINGDNQTDAVDVQLVINGALGIPVAFATDVNDDGSTDAIDVQLVINAVLGL